MSFDIDDYWRKSMLARCVYWRFTCGVGRRSVTSIGIYRLLVTWIGDLITNVFVPSLEYV